METQNKTLEQVLEEGESKFPEITALYNWSLNYEAGKGPIGIFLDLIGYSKEELGTSLYSINTPEFGYLELDYLGDALKEYANKGESAYDFVVELITAEVSA